MNEIDEFIGEKQLPGVHGWIHGVSVDNANSNDEKSYEEQCENSISRYPECSK